MDFFDPTDRRYEYRRKEERKNTTARHSPQGGCDLSSLDSHSSRLSIPQYRQPVGDESQAKMRLEALKDIPILEIDDQVKVLAKKLLDGLAVPEKCVEDALHIAVAARNGIDVIVTWNFKHINNPFTRTMVRQVIENSGFACPEICSPDELGDET